jgi:hypothetical protein
MDTTTNRSNPAGADDPAGQTITFVQFDEPALKVEEYTIKVTQTTNTALPNSFSASRNFAVTGPRFSFDSGEIDSVFPPDLANGEFDGSLPCVVLNRRTLPWERYLDLDGAPELPWLAVLVFDADSAPKVCPVTASDLAPLGQQITVTGNPGLTGTGKLPANILSYPDINPLGYGETPDQPCNAIDVGVDLFTQVASSMADMAYLAHIRQVDTVDTVSNGSEETIYSVVLGNRIAANGKPAIACLVSLERMGPWLPGAGGQAAMFPRGVDTVRLICYRSWRYTANDLAENFQALLENLNGAAGASQLTALQLPTAQPIATGAQVQQALAAQARGALDAVAAQVLVQNAFAQGYVPMNHEMRHADTSVSWYRGPLVPLPVAAEPFVPAASPDAAARYNPETGLFDVSYSAAWQLGQLLALQNTSYANALFNWKKAVNGVTAAQAEQAILEQKLGFDKGDKLTGGFSTLVRSRRDALAPPPLPDEVAAFLADLRLLRGVPFSYLVPHERMLPLESLRFFHLDSNWIDCLVDGAFSIGRTCSRQLAVDAQRFGQVKAGSDPRRLNQRRQRKGRLYAANNGQEYSGFLLRSQVVAGWPNLQVNGYGVPDDLSSEIRTLRMERLGPDCLVCIFDGVPRQVALHEPPEQLHCGVEEGAQGWTTTLRAVTGSSPGSQFLVDPAGGPASAAVAMRADQRTLQAAAAADAILAKLNGDFGQGIGTFTSAEFALQMVKGVVKVNFNQQQ